MSDVVIKVENLSKRYRLGLIGRTALHEDLSRWWARLRGKPDPTMRLDELEMLEARQAGSSGLHDDAEHIWALRDLNFNVQQGEVLGIVGKNGAGKSTLLKILSRVTAPTVGCVKVKGRIASLLEVGTGFHPELTGRENIFLNGAILGMNKAEIRGKFDDIVNFAGLEKFIDTPVKRYSSGMYVRLAFAVAAHLEPEILVVDEVLAVGDTAFQKKCLGKMKDVAEHGRTVLFVSHNLSSVSSLCPKAILLSSGTVIEEGKTENVLEAYLSQTSRPSSLLFKAEDCDKQDKVGDSIISLENFRLLCQSDRQTVSNGDSLRLVARVSVHAPCDFSMCVPVRRAGAAAFYANSYHENSAFSLKESGTYEFEMAVPPYLLNPGAHEFGIYVSDERGAGEHHIRVPTALSVDIEDDGVRRGGLFHGRWPGAVSPTLNVDVRRLG